MDIRILDSGFVTGDFLKPVAYAGEINSRKLNIIHPMFKDCVYQVLVKRYDGLYRLGVDDGMAEIPPSLTKTATTLECQFVAVAMPDTVNNVEVDDFVFMSSPFSLTVAEGLNTGGISPVPPYEEIKRMYNEIETARLEVEKAKKDNERILQAIVQALDNAHKVPLKALENSVKEGFRKQLEDLAGQYKEDFIDSLLEETVRRVLDELPEPDPDGCNCPSESELTALIESTVKKLLDESKSSNVAWYKAGNARYNQTSQIIGG